MNDKTTFEQVIADARAEFACDHISYPNDLFDYQLATGTDSGPDSTSAAQAIGNAIYRLANGKLREELTELGDDPNPPLDVDDPFSRPESIRARRLRSRLQPHLDALTDECRRASYTGWSKYSTGPIRRASELTVEE